MFEHDHSAARGQMAVRGADHFPRRQRARQRPAHKLFDTVHVERVEGVTAPRKYSDYRVWLDDTLPAGVICERLS